ncbi:peptidase M15 [Shewanella sp. OPT22]|nr:peptidase M15 [Shewanella sp. OPT22]
MCSQTISNQYLYGLDSSQLIEVDGFKFEHDTADAFSALVSGAKQDGIDIAVCSSYRSFEAQAAIWNNKATGKRKVLNKASEPIDISALSAAELVRSILTWSALPGTSRHHWGTDIDVFDPRFIAKKDIQLIPQEYQVGGPCEALSLWLDKNANQYGFYRPYQQGKSGVSPEPWHISFSPKSLQYMALFDKQELRRIITEQQIELFNEVDLQLEDIVTEYFYRVASADHISLRS